MALGRFLRLLRVDRVTAAAAAPVRACAAARARAFRAAGEPHLSCAQARARATRACAAARGRAFRADGEALLACAQARVRATRACAVARGLAFRAHGEALLACAQARARATRACAVARGRAFRADGDAIFACAQARARATRARLILLQQRTEAAANLAAYRIRTAHDRTASFILWVAYGQSAPKTPSPLEVLLKVRDIARRAENIWKTINNIVETFQKLDPHDQAILISIFVAPFVALVQDLVPTAPECDCPFLGLRGLPFDAYYPVDEGLLQVLSLATKCAGVVILSVGCLVICAFIDLYDICCSIWLAEGPPAVVIPDYALLSTTKVEICSRMKMSKLERDRLVSAFLFVHNAAYCLEVKGRLDLTCQTVADKGKTCWILSGCWT